MAKAAHAEDFRKLVEIHLKETEGHADTIHVVAELLGGELPERSCKGMKGLIHEAVTALARNLTSPIRDIALIAAAQKIEHYEIAACGTLCARVKELGFTAESTRLTSTLQQERTADELLTGVALGSESLAELIKKHMLNRATAHVLA